MSYEVSPVVGGRHPPSPPKMESIQPFHGPCVIDSTEPSSVSSGDTYSRRARSIPSIAMPLLFEQLLRALRMQLECHRQKYILFNQLRLRTKRGCKAGRQPRV